MPTYEDATVHIIIIMLQEAAMDRGGISENTAVAAECSYSKINISSSSSFSPNTNNVSERPSGKRTLTDLCLDFRQKAEGAHNAP